MTAPTPQQILGTPMGDNDAGAATVREYLVALARGAWTEGEGFSGKRPFGSSSWRYEVYAALGDAGYIRYVRDEDGYCEDCDSELGNKLISSALAELVGRCPPHDVRTDFAPLWSAPKDRGGALIGYCARCPWEETHQRLLGDDGEYDDKSAR